MIHQIKNIGVIYTDFKVKEDCPVQGMAKPEARGRIEIFPEYEEGLVSIDSFSHLILLYLFDRAGEIKLCRKPFLDDQEHGIFATRHPCRPNGIGLSIVTLEKRQGRELFLGQVDMLDESPLIDIKPYIPKFDFRENANNGWFDKRDFRQKPKGRE